MSTPSPTRPHVMVSLSYPTRSPISHEQAPGHGQSNNPLERIFHSGAMLYLLSIPAMASSAHGWVASSCLRTLRMSGLCPLTTALSANNNPRLNSGSTNVAPFFASHDQALNISTPPPVDSLRASHSTPQFSASTTPPSVVTPMLQYALTNFLQPLFSIHYFRGAMNHFGTI